MGDLKKSDSNSGKGEMQQMVIPGFVGNSQGLLADQLARGGYGSPEEISGILGQIHQPMTMNYMTDPNTGAPVYSGGAYMDALRNGQSGSGGKSNVPFLDWLNFDWLDNLKG